MIKDSLREAFEVIRPVFAGSADLSAFAQELKCPEFIAVLLRQRGVSTAEEARQFFLADETHVCRADSLKNFPLVLEKLLEIRSLGEPVIVHGDYDVDGVAGAALLLKGLRRCGFKVEGFLPNRFVDGYGVTCENVERLWHEGYRWMITVDTGICAQEEVAFARKLGMGMIITDHHQPGDTLPDTPYILNPNQPGCTYPNKGISGTGVAFKLMEVLYRELLKTSPDELLDLVALATLADMSPLGGENRHLVRKGLRQMEAGEGSEGIRQLLELAGLTGEVLTSKDVLFKMTPLLNSAGRLDHPETAFKLLLADERAQAQNYARQLNRYNEERRLLDRKVFSEAVDMCAQFEEDACIVVASEEWHEGVLGIVAAKLVEKLNKPALVISLKSGMGKGSGRTTPQVNLHQTLQGCGDLMEKWGGHFFACGFTVKEKNISALRARLNSLVGEINSQGEIRKKIEPHVSVNLREIHRESLLWLRRMEPVGPENEQPLLFSAGLSLQGEARVVGGTHLKFSVSQSGWVMPVIAFGMGYLLEDLRGSDNFGLAYYPEWNVFQGIREIQLRAVAFDFGEVE